MLQIMETYGWDYQTFISQPTWIISLATEKLMIQAEQEERRQKENA